MNDHRTKHTLYAGRHLSLHSRGNWEFASRTTSKSAVGIIALTDDNRVVLVEQHRPPVDGTVIELPAGLAGDVAGGEGESLLDAAKRELLEETGYVARHWTELGSGYPSPGLTDEAIVLFLAQGLGTQSTGGGDGTESIQIHHVAVDSVVEWLAEQEAKVDLKLMAGLFVAQEYREWRQTGK